MQETHIGGFITNRKTRNEDGYVTFHDSRITALIRTDPEFSRLISRLTADQGAEWIKVPTNLESEVDALLDQYESMLLAE